MYLEATGEAFQHSLDLSHIVFAKGRRADLLPPLHHSPQMETEWIGGDWEPECYR